jgi:hypothetical protein
MAEQDLALDALVRAYHRWQAGFGLPAGVSEMQAQRAYEEHLREQFKYGDDWDDGDTF